MKLLAPIYALTNPTRPVSRVTFIILALVTCILDQLSKIVVVLFLPESTPMEPYSIPLIPGLLDLRHVVNTGAAWSIGSGHTSMLAGFSILISVVIAVMAWRFSPAEQGIRIGLGLVLGGAVGNLIDRVRLGYVIDFIDAHWFDKAHWPIFNVADTAICIGIGLWLVASMRYAPREKTAKQSS